MEKYLVINDYSQVLEEFNTREEAQNYINENCLKKCKIHKTTLNLSFLKVTNLDKICTKICTKLSESENENITIFHNGFYLPIYFKKSKVKEGKKFINEMLKEFEKELIFAELVKTSKGYRIIEV